MIKRTWILSSCIMPLFLMADMSEESPSNDAMENAIVADTLIEGSIADNTAPVSDAASSTSSISLADSTTTKKPKRKKYRPNYYITLSHNEGKGIGYGIGYTTLSFYQLAEFNVSHFTNADVKLHEFNNGNPALNIGFGHRFILKDNATALGFNLYYDNRYNETKVQSNYVVNGTAYHRKKQSHIEANQFGIGFEALTTQFDFRANGYIPFSKTKSGKIHFPSPTANNPNRIKEIRKVVLYGVDAELGKKLYQSPNFSLYGAVGAYFFENGRSTTDLGGKLRLGMNIFKRLSIEGRVTHDGLFKTRGEGVISLNIPIGRKEFKDCFNENESIYSLRRPPARQEMPVIHQRISYQ